MNTQTTTSNNNNSSVSNSNQTTKGANLMNIKLQINKSNMSASIFFNENAKTGEVIRTFDKMNGYMTRNNSVPASMLNLILAIVTGNKVLFDGGVENTKVSALCTDGKEQKRVAYVVGEKALERYPSIFTSGGNFKAGVGYIVNFDGISFNAVEINRATTAGYNTYSQLLAAIKLYNVVVKNERKIVVAWTDARGFDGGSLNLFNLAKKVEAAVLNRNNAEHIAQLASDYACKVEYLQGTHNASKKMFDDIVTGVVETPVDVIPGVNGIFYNAIDVLGKQINVIGTNGNVINTLIANEFFIRVCRENGWGVELLEE